MSKTYGILFIIVLLLSSSNLLGQENKIHDASIHYGAMAQMHFSAAQSDSANIPYGFRLRRLDIKTWGSPLPNFEWSLLVGFNYFKFQILEVDVNYKINDLIRFRVGQFAPPAMRSGAPVDSLFKVPTMSFIERPPITLNWSTNAGLYAYRTFGIQLHGNAFNKKIYYAYMLGNPNGAEYFNASTRNTNHLHLSNGLSHWGRIEYIFANNIVSGIFANTSNEKTDTISIKRNSYGGHFLAKKNNLSFMTEFTLGSIKNVKTINYSGFFIEGAYRIKKIEPALRFDWYQPNTHSADPFNVTQYYNYTLGVNFYPIKGIKIQANYIFKEERMISGFNQIKNDLFYINFQYVISSKSKTKTK